MAEKQEPRLEAIPAPREELSAAEAEQATGGALIRSSPPLSRTDLQIKRITPRSLSVNDGSVSEGNSQPPNLGTDL